MESLNFQITIMIALTVSGLLMMVVIGVLLLPVIAVYAFVMVIIAAIKAADGYKYRYPLTIRFVK